MKQWIQVSLTDSTKRKKAVHFATALLFIILNQQTLYLTLWYLHCKTNYHSAMVISFSYPNSFFTLLFLTATLLFEICLSPSLNPLHKRIMKSLTKRSSSHLSLIPNARMGRQRTHRILCYSPFFQQTKQERWILLVLNRTRIEFELLLNCRESTIHSSHFPYQCVVLFQ